MRGEVYEFRACVLKLVKLEAVVQFPENRLTVPQFAIHVCVGRGFLWLKRFALKGFERALYFQELNSYFLMQDSLSASH